METKNLSENIAKMVIISKAPDWAKMIVDAIPDLQYQDYLKNYRAIWNIALPASAVLVMQKYVNSELGKTFVAHMAAGIARAINDRAKTHSDAIQELSQESFLDNEPAVLEGRDLQIKDCLCLLNAADLKLAMKRISALPEDQMSNLLASFVMEDDDVDGYFEMFREAEKVLSKKILNLKYPAVLTKVDYLRLLLVEPTPAQFRAWASAAFDPKRRANQRRIAKEKYNIEL